MVKRIPVLWFIEHVARELDVACAVKSLSKSLFDLDITIRHIYHHANQVLREYDPLVIVLPFFYRASGLAIKEYTEMWPSAVYFNLAWEEIFYKAQNRIKAPSDTFTREKVFHHAWGDFYKKFLMEHLVSPQNIFVNGNPAYALYQSPYKAYYKSRALLAKEHGLDPRAKWVFVPENYRWAFVSDKKLNSFVTQGGDRNELLAMRAFCKESLKELLNWCNIAAENPELEIIFRPRPSTSAGQMQAFFQNVVKSPALKLHFIKDGSVREWILASDLVTSSYSTSLIEAAIAGKPTYMSEPIPIPSSIYCDWHDYVPRLVTEAEFQAACMSESWTGEPALASWARSEMLSRGDPIKGLAGFLSSLVDQGKGNDDKECFYRIQATIRAGRKRAKWRAAQIRKDLRAALASFSLGTTGSNGSGPQNPLSKRAESSTSAGSVRDRRRRSFFNPLREKTYGDPFAHEGDQFEESEVRRRVEAWDDTLAHLARSYGIRERTTHPGLTEREC